MTTGTNWRNDAACLDVDPDLFFPVETTGPAVDQIDEAKRICLACPVRKRCLAWALEVDAAAGIWGGMTERERRALRRAAARHPDRTIECPPGHDERLDMTHHG